VTTLKNTVDHVVTEWGIARLRGRSIRERAQALIEIAHSDHREQLLASLSALLIELVGDVAHVRLELGEQFADGGREPSAPAGDDGEGVIQRRLKDTVPSPGG
jgi:acyl-CoA hydrolase